MSSTNDNSLTKNYRGKFGNQLVYRNRGGVSIMAKLPRKSQKPAGEAQLAQRRKFKMASRWAKQILLDPVMLAEYTMRADGLKSPYNLAITNYLRPPEIQEINIMEYNGEAGSKIKVVAVDDFKITGVTVKITDAAGSLIEQGPCYEDLSADCWVYIANVAVTDLSGVVIRAEASDTPCHTTSLEITL